MTCASSKAMDCCSVTDPDTPIVSRRKACRLRCYFCSSTNGSAVPSPTANSTTGPLTVTSRLADWNPLTTAPTKPSSRSSICSLRDDHFVNVIVGVLLSRTRQGRIYSARPSPTPALSPITDALADYPLNGRPDLRTRYGLCSIGKDGSPWSPDTVRQGARRVLGEIAAAAA